MYKDYLSEMLKKQDELQSDMISRFPFYFKSEEDFLLKNARWIQDEIYEFIEELKGFDKPWKGKDIEKDKLKEELIDAFHFMLNLFNCLQMTSEDIYKEYIKKNAFNKIRFND